MTYRPGRKTNESPQGLARLAWNDNKTVCLVQFDPDQKGNFAGKKYKVSDWPEWVKIKEAKKNVWNVRLGKDNIFSMYPAKGYFTGKVIGIAHKNGEKPKPKLVEKYYEGKVNTYETFAVLLEIVDGPYGVGSTVPCTLRYYFEPDGDGNAKFTGFGPNARYGPQLEAVTVALGAWDKGAIKWPKTDNILPKLEKRMIKAGHNVLFQIKDGWIVQDSIDRIGDDGEPVDDPLWDDDLEPEVEDDDAPF